MIWLRANKSKYIILVSLILVVNFLISIRSITTGLANPYPSTFSDFVLYAFNYKMFLFIKLPIILLTTMLVTSSKIEIIRYKNTINYYKREVGLQQLLVAIVYATTNLICLVGLSGYLWNHGMDIKFSIYFYALLIFYLSNILIVLFIHSIVGLITQQKQNSALIVSYIIVFVILGLNNNLRENLYLVNAYFSPQVTIKVMGSLLSLITMFLVTMITHELSVRKNQEREYLDEN